MKTCVLFQTFLKGFFLTILTALCALQSFAQPANDNCSAASIINTATTCVDGGSRLINQTLKSAGATAGVPANCGNASSADVWYKFTAETAYPTITLGSVGSDFNTAGVRIQLLTTTTCLAWTSLSCVIGTSMTTTALNGGAGLTVGQQYYIRIYSNITGTAGLNWGFSICVSDPSPSRIQTSRSYINVTKGATGGTISPGDTLEMRATFVLFSGTAGPPVTVNASADSLSYIDTLFTTKGFSLVSGSICMRTNEGLVYRADQASKVPFTDAQDVTDAGYFYKNGSDTIVRINFGANASYAARGQLSNTSRPSVFGSTCIIMATYRVRVYAPYNSKLNFKTGGFTYRDRSTGISSKINFVADSLIVYDSPGLCPNAVSATNAIGVEFNGTFGAASGAAPLLRNRGTTSYTPTYIYQPFNPGVGPGDYYYAIASNTSSTYTTSTALFKPDAGGNRLFNLWDVMGDHTAATNTTKGNPPCDTTKPVSTTNPCGYMLVINSAYKTDTAFHYSVTNLCPNTYYEIAAWFKNICSKCGCDSLGKGSGDPLYQAGTPGDTSGVKPNIAFDVNGIDYYTTGNLSYQGLLAGVGAQKASDSTNKWVKRGFTYLTGATQTSFLLTLRNNAPGGGGNDWAMDDIAVATCLPNMQYSPSLVPNVCRRNPITINDTIRSYFNNYVYYIWQRSTNAGVSWTNVTSPQGPAAPVWNGSAYQYVTSYTVPVSDADTTNNGDKYRVVVATTAANLSSANCIFTDGISIITLNVLNCGIPLKTELLSLTGKLAGEQANLTWITSKEEEPVQFNIERSSDGQNFFAIGTVSGHNDNSVSLNTYIYNDPVPISGKRYYRIVMMNRDNIKKYSRTIPLSHDAPEMELINLINPFSDKLYFDISMPADGKIEVVLMDMFGKLLRKSSYIVKEGINNLVVTGTDGLPAGVYIFQLCSNDKMITRKVLKKLN